MADTDSAAIAAENEDAEVDMSDLVARLMAANKAAQGGGGQTGAPSLGGITPAAPVVGGGATKRSGEAFASLIRKISTSKPSLDEEAKKGQFGWFRLMDIELPYILRSGTSYIPIKVVERSVFGELIRELPLECVQCSAVEAIYITDAEAKLLNEVNMKHSEGAYGKETFSQRDKMVTQGQFEEFVKFMIFCRKAVLLGESPDGEAKRCGVVKVKAEGESSLFPYILLVGLKWVPLAYFEGQLGHLKSGSKSIRGLDLSYLRLASRMIGIGKEQQLTALTCSVVRFDTVLSCFPSKPKVDELWKPNSILDRAKANNSPTTVVWTVMGRAGPTSKYTSKLTLIKEFPEEGSGPHYKAIPIQVEGMKLVGVNVKPKQWHDLFLPLPDLVDNISGLGVEEAAKLLSGKGANLFRANQGQLKILEEEGKTAWEPMPLLRLGDVKKHLALLKLEASLPPNKRTKSD